jgi:hypothetical protein
MKTILALILSSAAVLAYDGDATFYGAGGAGQNGACGLSHGFNGVQDTVAVGPEHFRQGKSCGRCIQIYSSGEGNGVRRPPARLFATVDNLCPECQGNNVDLALDGDGIWRVHWEFVPCDRRLRG